MAGGGLPFEAMKLTQLKEELAARGANRSGLKPALQRRLHGLLVQAAIARRAAAEGSAVEGAAGAVPGPQRQRRRTR